MTDYFVICEERRGSQCLWLKGTEQRCHLFSLAVNDLSKNRVIIIFFESFKRSFHPLEIEPPTWNVTLVHKSLLISLMSPRNYSDRQTFDVSFLALA